MKRFPFLLGFLLFSLGLYAQQRMAKITNNGNYVTITATNIETQVVTANFTPNANCHHFDCMIAEESVMEGYATQYNTTIDLLVSTWGFHDTEEVSHSFTDLNPNTEYVIYARPFQSDGTAFSLDTIHLKTAALGGGGIANIQVEISNIKDSSVVMIAAPNENTSVFHDGLVTKELFEQVGQDSAVRIIQTNLYPQYSTDTWTWSSLTPNTDYKAIAIGQNALSEWGEPTIVDFKTLAASVGFANINSNTDVKIYPQPSNGNFVIENPYFTEKMISIYDIKGRLVHQELWKSTRQEINLPELNEGTYLLQLEQGRMAHKILIKK